MCIGKHGIDELWSGFPNDLVVTYAACVTDPTESALPSVLEVASEDGSGPIELDGREASTEERARAEAGLLLLEHTSNTTDPQGSAADLLDASALALGVLDQPARALALAFEANAALPSLRTSRALALAATLARNSEVLLSALETEARLRGDDASAAPIHLERSAILHREGKVEAARRAVQQALAAAPNDLSALVRGEACAADGREGEALAEKIAALVADADVRANYLSRAAYYARVAGDLDRATTLAERAASSPSISADVERESIHLEAGRHGSYAAIRERQIEQGLVRADAGWTDIAIVGGLLGGDDELLERSLCELSADPALEPFALRLRGARAARDRLHEQSVEFETRRAQSCSDDALRCATILGRAARVSWLELRDAARAAELFARAVTIGAGPATCQWAASFFAVHGDPDGEKRALSALLAVAPSGRVACEARVRLAMAHVADAPQDAVSLLVEALRDAPGDPVPLHLLAVLLRRLGRAAELDEILRAQLALDLAPSARARILFRHASILDEQIGDREGALRALDEALSLAPCTGAESAERILALGWSELSASRWRDVEAQLGSTTEQAVAATLAYRRLARLLVDDPLGAEIDTLLSRGLEAPGTHPLRAVALSRSAGEALAAALEQDAHDCDSPDERAALHCRAAAALDALGKTTEALEHLRRAHELAPQSVEVEEELSWLLLRERGFQELRPLLDGMAQRNPDDVSRWLLLGALCEVEGSHAAAALAYHQADERGLDVVHPALCRALTQAGDAAAAAAVWANTGVVPPWCAEYRAARAAASAGDDESAREHFTSAVTANADAIDARLDLARLLPAGPERVRLLRPLRQSVQDPGLQVAFLRDLASSTDAVGDEYASIALYREILDLVPRDPVANMREQSILWRRHDRAELVMVARRAGADARLEDELRGAAQLLAGSLLEELGAKREAADALEAALGFEGASRSRWALLALVRLYGAMDDNDLAIDATHRLAETFSQGREAALCMRWIAARHVEDGRHAEALDCYHAALAADPCDYDALRAMESLLDPADPQLVDALLRAAATETDTGRAARLAVTLAHRLASTARLSAAAEILDRVLASRPDDLHVLMARAEVALRGTEWPAAAVMLRALVAHPDAAPEISREARYHLIEVLAEHLDRATEAERVLEGGPTDDSVRALELRYRIEIRLERHAAAARTLETLASRASVPAQKAEALLALAALRDTALGDAAGAAEALEQISTDESQSPAVLARLVAMATDPRKASAWQRQLVTLDPRNLDHLHNLRALLVEASDLDGAFCVEAVLVGMDAASDDEGYFHRQRRGQLTDKLRGPLPHETLLRIVCPEHERPSMKLLAELAGLAGCVFPIDWAAVGALDGSDTPPPAEVQSVVTELSDALGVPTPSVHVLSSGGTPVLDPATPPRFLLPGHATTGTRRDISVLCGALFGRSILGLGTLDHGPGVENVGDVHLHYFVEAAVQALVPAYVPRSSGVVYEDIRDKVLTHIEDHLNGSLQRAADAFVRASEVIDFAEVHAICARSAARLAVLAARDPAAALRVLLHNPALLSRDPETLEIGIDAAIVFAVSEEHAVLRRLLGTDLGAPA